jgi:hypothetical protein
MDLKRFVQLGIKWDRINLYLLGDRKAFFTHMLFWCVGQSERDDATSAHWILFDL